MMRGSAAASDPQKNNVILNSFTRLFVVVVYRAPFIRFSHPRMSKILSRGTNRSLGREFRFAAQFFSYFLRMSNYLVISQIPCMVSIHSIVRSFVRSYVFTTH
jgi:hypothetical protein